MSLRESIKDSVKSQLIKATGAARAFSKELGKQVIRAILESEPVRPIYENAKGHYQRIEAQFLEVESLLNHWIKEAQQKSREAYQKASRQASRAQHARKNYEILGVRPGASLQEIKAAWRKKMQECHPDHCAGNPESEARAHEQAQELNLAYQELVALLTGRENRRA